LKTLEFQFLLSDYEEKHLTWKPGFCAPDVGIFLEHLIHNLIDLRALFSSVLDNLIFFNLNKEKYLRFKNHGVLIVGDP